jgi:hypothetical protein
MALNPFVTSGAKIYIAPAATAEPANATAYGALTWTEIGNIASYAPFGDSVNIINAPVVGDGRVRKATGSADSGNMTLRVYPDDGDAGQTALIAAVVNTGITYPIKIAMPNASKITSGGTIRIRYFLALAAGGRETLGGNEDLVTEEYTLALTTKITRVAAT